MIDRVITESCENNPAELEFMAAMQEYKQRCGRRFPTWGDDLEVLTGLGYGKKGEEAALAAGV
jgi:hypothetical protein